MDIDDTIGGSNAVATVKRYCGWIRISHLGGVGFLNGSLPLLHDCILRGESGLKYVVSMSQGISENRDRNESARQCYVWEAKRFHTWTRARRSKRTICDMLALTRLV